MFFSNPHRATYLLGALCVGLLGCPQEETKTPMFKLSNATVDLGDISHTDLELPLSALSILNQDSAALHITLDDVTGEGADLLFVGFSGYTAVAPQQAATIYLSVSTDVENWSSGSYEAELKVEVGKFIQDEDGDTGAMVTSEWVDTTITIPVTFSINCDDDNDGIEADVCGGEDCDDEEDTIGPGAAEICDGIDQDCDGTVDEECTPDEEAYVPRFELSQQTVYLQTTRYWDAELPMEAFSVLNVGVETLYVLPGEVSGMGSELVDVIMEDYTMIGGQTAASFFVSLADNIIEWESGSYTVELPLEIGAFFTEPDSAEGAGVWSSTQVSLTIEFGIDCDADEDGFDSDYCAGDDCHDVLDTIFPGAEEECDSIDNNCDGTVDEECGGETVEDFSYVFSRESLYLGTWTVGMPVEEGDDAIEDFDASLSASLSLLNMMAQSIYLTPRDARGDGSELLYTTVDDLTTIEAGGVYDLGFGILTPSSLGTGTYDIEADIEIGAVFGDSAAPVWHTELATFLISFDVDCDLDDDSWDAIECGGHDCDDTNPLIGFCS